MRFFLKQMMGTNVAVLSAVLLTVAACASPSSNLQSGKQREEIGGPDRQLHYTCRLKDGEIIETTRREVAADTSMKKERVFAMKQEYGPLPVVSDVDGRESAQGAEELRYFNEVLLEEISKITRGWGAGETGRVLVTTDKQVNVPENERAIWLARVRRVPKEKLYSREDFTRMTAADAEEGAVFYPFPEVKGTVVSVEENVVVTFSPVSDKPWKGRFGTSTVIDKGDHFEIDTDVQVGRLVRVGPLLGRISEIEREKFKVDYSHAFGGEALVCDVRVEEAPEGDVSDGIRTQLSEALNARMKTQEESNLPKSARRTELASPASAEDCDKIENSRPEDPSRENSEVVQLGDLVTADFTASLETGEVVGTTWPHVIDNPDTETVDWYEVPEAYMPETFVAGEEASVPGLGNAVLGMHAGETRHLVLPPERAYGQPNMRGVKEFNRVLSMPKIADISVEDYKKRFGGPPSKGHVVDYNPYMTAEVLEVSLQSATLALTPRMKKDESEIGTTEVRSEGDKIELMLTPKIGAPFRVGNSAGKIVSSDPKKFAVDFNHPMAGKKLVLDVYVHSLKKAATLKDAEIEWVEDHNSGLEMAKKEDKPVVMVLYADWCKWCKRMFNETFTDIQVQRLKKDFVWLKVNSDKDKSLKGQYGQQGYPLTVILDSEGQVIEKLPGFQTAQGLAGKLDGVLETFTAASSAKVDPRESGQRDQQI